MGLPDADIFPHATGKASEVVAKHKSEVGPEGIKFYAGWFCPYVQKTWIALLEKQIPFQYIEINPYHKDPSFLAINPKGLVPAIESQGSTLAESNILIEFLEDFADGSNSKSSRKLLPAAPQAKAVARMHIDQISKKIVPAWFRTIQAQDSQAQAQGRKDYTDALKEWATYIDDNKLHNGPFHGGDELDAVDINLAPFVAREYLIEKHRGGPITAEETGETYQIWRKAILSHPSVVSTTSDKENYEPIYGRYLRDEAQSEAAKATRGGRAIP
ncbi:Glutathione S-transferase [Ceraceosorus bombacis]|uniref:Glutathione S-transferase n=1 Tax=Ceraceosorus bombacis TaxID=401625 RepID=A0A0P1BE64_9BASI|nr:Glutathione S-transferase [Ceraceosorus bombacis]